MLAIALIALSIALIMAPAALHRQLHPKKATEEFVRISSRLVLCSMPPLVVSVCIEFHLISRIILGGVMPGVITAFLFLVFFALWFLPPRRMSLRRVSSRHP